jgi:hypothetical protein
MLQPAISVVVASWSGEETLRRCLDKLLPQDPGAEVIVSFRGASDVAIKLNESYPGVRFTRGPSDGSVFLLRSRGVHEAHGRLIALLEDHAMVCSDWIKRLRAAHERGMKIFGGPIDMDEPAGVYDWALYFVEYGIYMPPMPEGMTPILSGVNIAYDREALLSCREIWESVFYESDVNDALRRAGYQLNLLPSAQVKSCMRMPRRTAMEHLFTGGMHFGELRIAQSRRLARLGWMIAAPAVPLVLLTRILRLTVARQPWRVFQIIAGLPVLLLFLGSWSAGEALSYARGVASRPQPATIRQE